MIVNEMIVKASMHTGACHSVKKCTEKKECANFWDVSIEIGLMLNV